MKFDSNRPLEDKQDVVRTLMHMAESVVSDRRELKEEKEHIRNALSMNGYLDWIIDRADSPKPQDQLEEEVEENKLVDTDSVEETVNDPK